VPFLEDKGVRMLRRASPRELRHTRAANQGTSFVDRFLEIPNTPVPIPAEAKIGEQQAIVAGNVAYRNLSSSQKQRQRLTLQPRIKWSDKERFHVGRLSAQSSTAK